jgi:hypothetical protein
VNSDLFEPAMLITLLGSIGIGLVWGWLIGPLGDRPRRKFLNVLTVSAATLSLAGLVYWFAGWQGTVFFLGPMTLAFLLHLGWRQELRRRFPILT